MSAHRFAQALSLLLQSHEYAKSLGCATWDFAVELTCLQRTGLTNSDLRWLLMKDYVHQAVEIIPASDHVRRSFVPTPTLSLDAHSCFILTSEGLAFALSVCEAGAGVDLAAPRVETPVTSVPIPSASTPPFWDKDRRVLRLGERIVKHFKVPAPNQELILTVFQEEEWPARIDDPLPHTHLIDPKRRLHDTINSLNRNQRMTVLRFLGDGNGQGICWASVGDPTCQPRVIPNGEAKPGWRTPINGEDSLLH